MLSQNQPQRTSGAESRSEKPAPSEAFKLPKLPEPSERGSTPESDIIREVGRASFSITNRQYPERSISIDEKKDPYLHELMTIAAQQGIHIQHDSSGKSSDRYKIIDQNNNVLGSFDIGQFDRTDPMQKLAEGLRPHLRAFDVLVQGDVALESLDKLGIALVGKNRLISSIQVEKFQNATGEVRPAVLHLDHNTAHLELSRDKETGDALLTIVDRSTDHHHTRQTMRVTEAGIATLEEAQRVRGPNASISLPVVIPNQSSKANPVMVYAEENGRLHDTLRRAANAGFSVEFFDGGKAMSYVIRNQQGEIAGAVAFSSILGNRPSQWQEKLNNKLQGLLP